MPNYKIGKLKGRFVVSIYDDAGRRTHRYRLGGATKSEAEREAPGVVAELTRPKGRTVAALWDAYVADKAGRAIVATMIHTRKALAARFDTMQAESITVEDCRAHARARAKAGIMPGTIATELGHLRNVLVWSVKQKLIAAAPHIERPTPPKRPEHHLTRQQCRDMIAAAHLPHLKLYLILALATGARNAALLELTWDRVDFERGKINLRNPAITRPHKGRAIVPMNRTLRAALTEAHAGALTDFVIEWKGHACQSVKRGIKVVARAAGIPGSVHPHLFRHTAAVHMAEAGIPMEEIAQMLGHDDVATARNIYARFSPDHLRQAAAALEYDDLSGSTNLKGTTLDTAGVPEYMVGATGIEPVTPTVSKKRA